MLYFMRHGQSQANVDGIFAGPRYPAPLTPIGRKQAEEEARRILGENIRIDIIISSPMERALQTAQIVAKGIASNPQDIKIDPRLAEYDMGDLSGTPMEGVTPEQKVSAPGAEDVAAFRGRVRAALEAARQLPGNTLLVSHAGVGRMLETIRRDMDPHHMYELEGYPNARIICLDA